MAYQLHWIERFLLTGTDLLLGLSEGEEILQPDLEARHAKTFYYHNNIDHHPYRGLC